MIREAFKDLGRLRQISSILARHGFGELVERARLRDRLGLRAEDLRDSPGQRPSSARRFRELLEELGPTFIKLGQVLSTRVDLLPKEVLEELSTLQNAVAPLSLEEVQAQIETGLGQTVEAAFEWLDPRPLASASIAQVHRARTHRGEEVVVKVQRPGIRGRIEADLDLLRYLARLLEATVEEVALYRPSGMVEEFERAIHEELNFESEAANLREFARTNRGRPQVVVPQVSEGLCSSTILTMSFLQGVKITEVLDPEQRKALARLVVEISLQQLFEDGVFHGDPHPGNLLVLEGEPTPRVGLLDFGVVGRLTPQMKQNLVALTLAIALKDSDTVARLLYRLGVPETTGRELSSAAAGGRIELAAFRSDIAELLGRYLGKTIEQVDATSLLTDLFDLAVRYRIRVPQEYALLSRAAIAVEGILRQLDPQLDIAAVAMPSLRRKLLSRFGGLGESGSFEGGLLRGLLRLQELATEVPAQLSQVLMDLEGGKFVVNVRTPAFGELTAAVRRLSVVVMIASLGSALVLGAFVSVSRQEWSYHGVPVLGVVAIALAAMLFGALASWYFVSVRFKKISISKWLGGPRG